MANVLDIVSQALHQPPQVNWFARVFEKRAFKKRLDAATPFDLTRGMADQELDPVEPPRLDESWQPRLDPNFWANEAAAQLLCDRVNGIANYPYRAIGRTLNRVGNVDKSGTAWAIGKRAIMTAGHCLFTDIENMWASSVVFAPQYKGKPALGQWTGVSAHVLAGWKAQHGDAGAYDVGVVILDKDLPATVGVLPCRTNDPPNPGQFHSVGYPRDYFSGKYPFDGADQWYCTGVQTGASSGLLEMVNIMTRGCSGGPWLLKHNGSIYANGLNSHRMDNQPERMRSPFFGANVDRLIAFLQQAGAL